MIHSPTLRNFARRRDVGAPVVQQASDAPTTSICWPHKQPCQKQVVGTACTSSR